MPDTEAEDRLTLAPGAPGDGTRSDAARALDHAAVARLAADLLPALIARLAESNLAELEVREGAWKVRLRRPLDVVGTGRRATDRQFRLPVGAAAPGHPAARPGAAPGHDGVRQAHDGQRTGGDSRSPVGAGQRLPRAELPAVTATAVGIFRPRPGISGHRVRAGDPLGAVDMLGVPQEIVAPVDGVVGPLLVEPGNGVEYGQPLIEMRPISSEGASRTEARAAVGDARDGFASSPGSGISAPVGAADRA